MRPAIVQLTAVLLLVNATVGSTARSQSPPSFAGQWARVDSSARQTVVAATGDGAFAQGDMGSGWGSPITIRQSVDSLIVDYAQFSAYDLQPRQQLAFSLAGGETRLRVSVGHTEVVQRARAAWQGTALVITVVHAVPPEVGRSPVEVQHRLTIDDTGRLVMETTRPGFGAANVTRTVFTKR